MTEKKTLSNHVIICGYGRVGEKIVDVLSENNISFIIIELNAEKAESLRERGYSVLQGDATMLSVLKAASIVTAKAIAIVMDDDAKNLFTILTARDINKNIFIATRANDSFLREKLIEAGADFVVMPQKSASHEILKELGLG
ncbi:MAG: NAD(P)-binding protein [Candidatus Micrarchaeaceae archaeon]|nr:NAD-binding protein [Candidatus Marsarchaeota archaeon]